MRKTVDQPTRAPTRKLTAATIATAVMAASGLVVRNLAPGWYDESTWAALMPVVVYVAGYAIRDRPNV